MKHIFLNTVLALSIPSIFSFYAISALAQGQPPEPSIQNQEVAIPQSSAITVTFSVAVTFDAGQKKSLPMAALLTQPLLDSSGKVVAPANSPVGIKLHPAKGGAQIQAEALVINGRIIPILALGPWIPGQTVTTVSSAQQAQLNQSVFSDLAGSVFGLFGTATGVSRDERTHLTNMGNYVGTGLGIVSGLMSPKTIRQVQIAEGTMYILTLQAPVTIPPKILQITLPTQNPTIPASVATPTTPPAQSQANKNKIRIPSAPRLAQPVSSSRWHCWRHSSHICWD